MASIVLYRTHIICTCSGISCPAVLVWCILLYTIRLARTTHAGRVDLVADLRVGLLLLLRTAEGRRGQPGLSSFTCWFSLCYGRQGQPDNLFGNIAFIGKNWVYPPCLEGLPNVQDGLTHFPKRVYPFSVEGIPDSCQVCFSDFSGWL